MSLSLLIALLVLQLLSNSPIANLENTITNWTQATVAERLSPESSSVTIVNYEPFSSGNLINNDTELLKIVNQVEQTTKPLAWGVALKIDTETEPHPPIFDRANVIPACIERATTTSDSLSQTLCDRQSFITSLAKNLSNTSELLPLATAKSSWNSDALHRDLLHQILTKIDRVSSSRVFELSTAETKKLFDRKIVLVGIFDDLDAEIAPVARTAIEIDRLIRANNSQHPLALFMPQSIGERFLWVFLLSVLAGIVLWQLQWRLWLPLAIFTQIFSGGLLMIFGRGLPIFITAISMILVAVGIWAIKQIGRTINLPNLHNFLPTARNRS